MSGSITSGARTISQQEVGLRAARAASGLKAMGFQPGNAVAIFLRNDFPFFEASFASALLGGYAVPVNWHLKGDEAGYIFRDCDAKVIVTHADLLPQFEHDIPPGVRVLVVPTPPEIQHSYGLSDAACKVPAGRETWDDFVAAHQPWTQPPQTPPNTMIYTSGTTGRPKGVRREPMTAEQVEGVTRQTMAIFGIGPGIKSVITGPMYHSAPNFYALHGARLGGQLWLQPRFDAEELLQWIEKYKIESLHMVPIMFVRLLKLPEDVKKKYDLSSLKHVVHAAAPCPPEVKRGMIEWWGPIIVEYYGATESGAVVFNDSNDWLENPGTVGKPHERCEVRILDVDGKEVPTGEIGEVYMRNRFYPEFTYNKADAKRREIERNGLITAGDVGYVNERGFLFLCDRSKDMIISGGVNIYPAEIESVLHTMPGVQDCAVFGIPDDEYGESVAAVVEKRPGVNLAADEVRSYLRERIAAYKVPRLVEFQRDLPREDSGKIFKRKLRDPYWEKAGAEDLMKALLCSRLGDPSVLELIDAEPPAPKPGEIGVRVRAASINFPDVLMVAGGYQLKPPLPFIPGMEACGEVVALGEGVREQRIGDRVIFGKRFGAFAEQVTVPAAEARPLPKGWSFAEGAAFAVGYKTAYHAIVQRGHLKPREVLLVHGASGGVGLAAVELGKVFGARVIATGSDDARLDVVREKGADFVLNYREAPFWQAVKDLTDGKGADVIYDPVGGDVFDQSLKCIAWNGRILLIGFTSGRIATLPTNIALIKGFSVIGVRAGEAVRREPQIGVEYHRELWKLADEGRIRPHISHILPLERWVEAMALLTERKVVGKAVLDLGGATQT